MNSVKGGFPRIIINSTIQSSKQTNTTLYGVSMFKNPLIKSTENKLALALAPIKSTGVLNSSSNIFTH